MRKKLLTTLLSVFLVVALTSVFALTAVVAQDATEEATQEALSSPIVCESSLLLLVGLAQRDYGFQSTTDLNEFERGQYSSLFDDSEGMEMSATDEAGMTMTDETDLTEGMDMLSTDEADMTATDEAGRSAVFLNPPIVVDEDTRCTQLRTEVEEFFNQYMQSGQMGGNNQSN
jgi:hypothetical protein